MTVAIYPAGHSEWTLIEDDGESDDYLQGAVAETHFQVTQDRSETRVVIGPRSGNYCPQSRHLTLRVHLDRCPDGLTLDGETLNEWHWDPEQQAAVASWADAGGHTLTLTHGP
ncbi:MAG: DUF5110 domain-containing protein [Gammaproteobacteria bacterium]